MYSMQIPSLFQEQINCILQIQSATFNSWFCVKLLPFLPKMHLSQLIYLASCSHCHSDGRISFEKKFRLLWLFDIHNVRTEWWVKLCAATTHRLKHSKPLIVLLRLPNLDQAPKLKYVAHTTLLPQPLHNLTIFSRHIDANWRTTSSPRLQRITIR